MPFQDKGMDRRTDGRAIGGTVGRTCERMTHVVGFGLIRFGLLDARERKDGRTATANDQSIGPTHRGSDERSEERTDGRAHGRADERTDGRAGGLRFRPAGGWTFFVVFTPRLKYPLILSACFARCRSSNTVGSGSEWCSSS